MTAFSYPVSLDVTGRVCVVVGGGEVAEHKARGLLEAGARVTVIAPDAGDGLADLAARSELRLVGRPYRRGDLAGAFVAIAATDDPDVNAQVFAEGEDERVLVNAVDDVSHCHFAAPSVVRRGDFCIAISTGGKAPALAKRVRRELAATFGPEIGVLVEILARARAQALPRTVPFEVWAARWQNALDHDLLGLVRAGRLDEAARLVSDALAGQPRAGEDAGRVTIVGAGPGDPELITVRGRRALEAADVVVYDRLVHPSLIEGKEAIYVGKQRGAATMAQEAINDLLVRLARAGRDVVRLKGGDPFVFGRGAEEAEAVAEAGIEVDVVPGPTSAVAVATAAGIPLTDRRFASSIAFATGESSRGRRVDWRALAAAADTIVVLMGAAKLRHISSELVAGGRSPETPAAAIADGTLPEQRVAIAGLGKLADAVASAGLEPPLLVVVGDVVSARTSAPRRPRVQPLGSRV